MPNLINIEQGKNINATYSFTEMDSNYSPASGLNKKSFLDFMNENKSLFDKAIDVNVNFNDNALNNPLNLDLLTQQPKWRELNDSLNRTRNQKTGERLQTKIIGFDFETLRVDVTKPYQYSPTSAVTELGIAETLVKKTNVSATGTRYSIAGGIDEIQLTQYLKDYKQFYDEGLDSFNVKEQQMIRSTMERLSRYGQSNIEDLLEMQHIANLGDVTVFKNVGVSKTLDKNSIIRGISHLAVLGGIDEDVFGKAVELAGLKFNPSSYAGMQERFKDAGLKVQTLNRNSETANRIVKYFNKQLPRDNTFVVGYNSNNFDLNIMRNFIGDVLNKSNTLDVYTAVRRVLGTTISQEKLSEKLGLVFQGVAHSADADSKITTEIIAKGVFSDNKGLSELVSEMELPVMQELNSGKKIYYALNSISFNKQGNDYLNSNRFNVSGVQRGRYYYIDGIKQYEDGRYGVRFLSAATNTNDEFIKVFDTAEEMAKTIENNFLVENKHRLSQTLIDQNDFIVNADKARRNYENLYSTRSITWNDFNKKYEGGFEKLNQYYKAYNIAASEIGNIDDSVIREIAETSNYDATIEESLRNAFDISEDEDVYKSLLRDFKASFGRVHDEAPMLGYMVDQLEGTKLNNYQKTIAISQLRDTFINEIENHKDGKRYTPEEIENLSYGISKRDMFTMEMKMSDEIVTIDFNKKEDATKKLINNFYKKAGKDPNKMQIAESMVKSVEDLYDRGLVDFNFFQNFYKEAGVTNIDIQNRIATTLEKQGMEYNTARAIAKTKVQTLDEIQPRRLAEMIATKIQDDYITPIIKSTFSYKDFVNQDFSIFENRKDNKPILTFFQKKSEITTGNIAIAKARGNKYRVNQILANGSKPLDVIKTVGTLFEELFENNDKVTSLTNRIISNAHNTNISLDENEIKRVLQEDLNWSESSAEREIRALFGYYGKGESKKPYGITTFLTDADITGKRKKAAYSVQFAYSGNKGEDAFVLVNLNKDNSSYIAKTMEIMADNSLDFKEKINMIKENNYAGVFQLKAIDRQEINVDTNDPFFKIVDPNGQQGYSLDTISIGDKGYKKIGQKKLAFWDHGTNNLEDFEITYTDDAEVIGSVYQKTKNSLIEILESDELSESEKYERFTRKISRTINNGLSDMPGPSGYQTLLVDGKYQKVLIPNIADILKSSQLQIQPLEILALETAKKDVLNNNTTMADTILELAGKDPLHLPKGKGREDILNDLIGTLKKGESISEEWNEYFLKHLVSIPMGLEENFTIPANKIESGFTFIDYFQDRLNKGYKYHEKTQGIINWLSSNKDRLSQMVNEKATHDKKIALLENLNLNQYAFFDSNIRPPANQQLNARRYIKELVEKQLGKDAINKLQIKLGYDAMPLQRAELAEALKNYEVVDGIKLGQMEDGITANYRNMNSSEIMSKFLKLDSKLDSEFKDAIAEGVEKFGISETESKYLLEVAYNIMKNRSANVYESRGIARASFVNNSYFLDPEIKTVEISSIDESQLTELKNTKSFKKLLRKNVTDQGIFLESGTKFAINGEIRQYNGPSGILTDDLDTFLTTGKGHLIEAVRDSVTGKPSIVQGVSSIKFLLGNEKGTLYAPEFNVKTGKDFLDVLGKETTAKNAFIYYLDSVFDKVFGEDVSAVFDLPVLKHRTNSTGYGSIINRMTFEVGKYMQKTGDTNIFTELSDIFTQADADGIRLQRYKDNITFDATRLGKHGAFEQVEKAIEIINTKANDSENKYQATWKKISDEIMKDEKLNRFRNTLIKAPNNESMGGAMNFDPRMELNLRSQFKEQVEDYITVEDGRKVNAADYIADAIRNESINNLKDTSKTPIDSNFGLKWKSAQNTLRGIELSAQYMNDPSKVIDSNLILDVKLEDIKIAQAGSDAKEIVKTSFYKIIDSDGPHYSDWIREAAKKQNKNIDDIAALRISLGDGISFDSITENSKKSKALDQLIVPLYDLTPFKGEVQYDNRIRDLNEALKVAKRYGISNGFEASREELNEKIRKLYLTLVQDLDHNNKKSYAVAKTLKTPMKNSAMLHADSTIVPSVNAVVKDFNAWTSDENLRDRIITAIKQGDISQDIDVSSTLFTGRKYTTVRNNVMYYDDIVELGEDALIDMGIDFKETGMDIYFDSLNNWKKYTPQIKEMKTSFFDINYAEQITKSGIQTKEVEEALKSQEQYNELLRKLKNRNIDNIDEIKADLAIVNSEFEKITKNYLSEVGTFGIGLRYPTFYKDSIGPVIIKFNETLAKDEMVVSGLFGAKINMDHDGDNGVVKLMVNDKGVVLNNSDSYLNKAFAKLYELRVFNLKNNERYAELIKDTAKEADKIVDVTHGFVANKRKMIETAMRPDTRKDLLTELKLENLIDKDISDYTDKEVQTVFKAWNNKMGNMIKNTEDLAAAIKARITKGQIGAVSNANYVVNQVMYESLNQAIEQGDNEAVKLYRDIITDLHIGNMGLLPLTEQKGIDVKHSYQGFTISEAQKYNQGIKELFKGNYDNGQKLIAEAMEHKFKDDERWPNYLDSITKLAKDKRAQINFKRFSPQISNLNKALEFMANALEYQNYIEQNGLGNISKTAASTVINTLNDVKNMFSMGYHRNVDGVWQSIYKDAIFISTEDGTPILYKAHDNVRSENGKHIIEFDTYDLNKGRVTKNGELQWQAKNYTMSGSSSKIQAELQNKFGDFRAYSLAEIEGNKSFKTQINQLAQDINVNKFANMYARGNTKMANKFLTNLQSHATKGSVQEKSINRINDYLSVVSDNNFTEFINKAKYLQANPTLQMNKAFEKQTIDDILTNINKQIIEQGKTKITSTDVSNIFSNELKKLANDIAIFDTQDYKNFAQAQTKASNEMANIFKDYNKNVIDMRKARNAFSQFENVNDEAEKILQKYKSQNDEYFDSLKINPATTRDIDTIFNWNTDNLADMRVGIRTSSGLYGRKFSDLSKEDVEEILKYSYKGENKLTQYAFESTKSNLSHFMEDNEITGSNALRGASDSDIKSLRELNEQIKKQGTEAVEEGLNAQGKRTAKEKAGSLLKKTLDKGKEFAKTTPGKVAMGLAALGLVSNMLSSDNESPLVPETNKRESTGPINNNSTQQRAPSSNTGRRTVYADNTSGLHFKMSAKSKSKINQMNAAKQLSAQTGGNTNVNIYDDRSQINNNWLERKFSELV